jgi:hypothetical protein
LVVLIVVQVTPKGQEKDWRPTEGLGLGQKEWHLLWTQQKVFGSKVRVGQVLAPKMFALALGLVQVAKGFALERY